MLRRMVANAPKGKELNGDEWWPAVDKKSRAAFCRRMAKLAAKEAKA